MLSKDPLNRRVGGDGRRSRRLAGLLLASLMGLAPGFAGSATAQELGEESRGFRYDDESQGFYSIEALPAGARLELSGRNRLVGPSPLTVPADIRGVYRLRVSRSGLRSLSCSVSSV